MSTSLSMPALGLAVDQHPGAAPKGAMSQADNVVGDLPGTLRGRPNNVVVYSEDGADPDPYARIDTLIRVGEEWIAHQGKANPTTGFWRNANGRMTGIEDGPGTTSVPCPYASARGSTYIGTVAGVAKLESALSNELLAAGVEMSIASEPFDMPKLSPTPTPPIPLGPFTGPFSVGYRLVVRREDVNGYIARSAPSMTFAVSDTSSATNGSILLWGTASDERWTFPDGSLRLGDVVEFYRTRIVASATGPLAPDYYLVATYEIDAADLVNGYFPDASDPEFYDTLADTQLGEALYTNPGREGALGARYTPPVCGAMALWSGAMWFGNVRERERGIHQLKTVGGGAETPTNLRASDGQSLGVNVRSGAWATGVAQVTGVADVTGVRVGQSVFTSSTLGPQGSADFPAETTITGISGAGPYTLALSAAPTTTNAGATIYLGDVVKVNGVSFYAGFNSTLADRTFSVSSSSAGAATRAAATSYSFALVVNAYMAANDGAVRIVGTPPLVGAALGAQVGLLAFEATAPDGQFSVGPSSAPDAFSPALNKALNYGATVKRNRLYWSQPNEPEAVQLLSFVDVGAEQSQILALSALHDALLVWKEDGLFRVTGAGPDRWSIDVLDSSLALSRSCAVDVLRGTAYAVTNRGVVAASEGGVVDLPAQGKVETLFREPTSPQVVCWERLGLVLFSARLNGQDDDYADTVYCLAVATGVWSRWPSMWHSTMSSAGREFYPFIATTRPDLLPIFEIRRFLPDEGRGYDHAWEDIAISSRSGSTLVVTDAARGDWYPTVGDWLSFGTVLLIWGRVLAVSYDGFAGEWTITLDRAVPGAEFATTLDAYEGAPVQLEWLPAASSSAPPFTLPVWREASFGFTSGPATDLPSQPNARLTLGVRHDQNNTVAEVVATPARATAVLRPYRIGWPREGARRAAVWPRLGFSEIAWPWRLAGLSMTGNGGGGRTRR